MSHLADKFMLFIYHPKINFLLRSILKPFAKIIPKKFLFPVNGTFQIKLEEGKSFKLICNPTSFLGRLLYWGGEKGFEYESIRIFKKLVLNAEVFFDIGANIGYYSLVASALNPKIKIVGFEPMPAAIKFFKKNIAINSFKNIQIEEIALSDKPGSITFYAVKSRKFLDIPDHLNGDGTINLNNINSSLNEQINVQTDTLDAFVERNKISRIDMMKMDTEASEHLILSESKNVLATIRPIIMIEVISNKIESDLIQIFEKNNYTFYLAEKRGLRKVVNLNSQTQNSKDDYFMVPSEKEYIVKEFVI